MTLTHISDDGRKLLELADRVEAATGADRELDCLIFVEVSDADEVCVLPSSGPMVMWGSMAARADQVPVPAYTASLDAALTLVPDEHDFMLMHGVGERALASAQHTLSARTDERHAATPALALCAAALKVRAALQNGGTDDAS